MTDHDGSSAPESEESSTAEPVRGSRLLPAVAIVLSLAAAGTAAWLVWQHHQDPLADAVTGLRVGLGSEMESASAERAELGRRIDELAERVDALEEARRRETDQPDPGARLESRLEALADDLNALEADLRGRLDDELAALEDRLEERIAESARTSGDAANDSAVRADARRLALQRAAALLARGQDELELAGDAELAREAFARAAEHLESLDDPRTGGIQRLVRGELQAIRSWQPPQWHDQVSRLHALAAAAGDWPLRAGDAQPPDPDTESGEGWRQRLARTFSGLVTVKRRDQAAAGPAEADALRDALQVVLASAGLAAARADGALVRVLVDQARERLDEDFDTGHPSVAAALEELESIAGRTGAQDPPAVGEARLAIRDLLDAER